MCNFSHRKLIRRLGIQWLKANNFFLTWRFSLHIVLTVSFQQIYGILANGRTNTATISIYIFFLKIYWKLNKSFSKKTNEKIIYVIDNSSINKKGRLLCKEDENFTIYYSTIFSCFKWSKDCYPSNKNEDK